LPVKARISMLNTDIPTGIDFGFCPTAETTEFKFSLKSTGQIDGTFQWTLPGAGSHGRPFSIMPASGEIRAGQTLDMTATFLPHTASVYVVTVNFVAQVRHLSVFLAITPTIVQERGETNQRQEKTMKISGIGKYAYFAASESELDFDEMLVGGSSTTKHPTDKEFVLRNRSLVRATFQIVPVENDHEPLFFFSPLRGVIPPEASVPITVKYTPLSPGTFTCDTFKIQTPGGHTVRVTCRGKAIGPLVSLWKKNLASNLIRATSINFKDVQVGAISTRVLILKNESNVAVRYNFMAAPNGVFQIEKVTGIVPPLLETSVMLTFRPESPGNFYRRLFILVQNQSTIYVDILGTGFDNDIRPSPFQQAHVDAYRLRCQHHWGHLSPDGLEALLEEKGDTYFLHGALRTAAAKPADSPKLLTRSGESTLTDVSISDEFFVPATSRSNAITVSESLLEFGSHGAKKTLVVTNQTRGKVTCSWRVSETTGAAALRSNFRISPAACDVAPGASVEFIVTFDPCHANAYYFAELESHVYFKSNRTFRLVNPETFTPPWCVVVYASGHSFASSDSQFLSKVTFVTAKDHVCPFPPAHVGDSVFQTVALSNASDTPALFSVVQDPSRVFWVHPASGLIPANGFHLVQIRFTPTHPRRYVHRLKTVVNYVSDVVVDLTGMGCRPQLTCVENDTAIDAIYIKPTAVGLTTTRQFYVHNVSRVPLVFRWHVPPALRSTFHVAPLVHRLMGNERHVITCVFSPTQLKQYNQRIAVHVKSISMGLEEYVKSSVGGRGSSGGGSTGLIQEASVKLLGVGTTGAVSFVPAMLTLPTVLVNSPTTMPFDVVNSSDCDLKYEISVHCRPPPASSTAPQQPTDDATTYISFSKPRGILGARSHQALEITFRADLAGAFRYDIACAVSTVDMAYTVAPEKCVKMAVDATASFPTLVIEDVRTRQTSTATAWMQLDVPAINSFLMTPLTKDELQLNADSSPDLTMLPSFHVHFTPAVVGSPSQVVHVQLRNPGSLVVSYRIFYPNESDVELEPWADQGEPTSDELRQNILVDSKLFSIAPRTGILQPHETLVLCLSYTYSSMQYRGIHDVPVTLNVAQGKKLTLVLHGRTLAPSTPHVFLPSCVSTLHPVMVGQCMRKTHRFDKPSVQQIPVVNTGDRPVQIDVDDSAWSVLNAHQFNFPVLECLTPHVIIPAHATGYIDVDFCPLENKTYTADLRLLATSVDTNEYEDSKTITVVARGYHAPATFADMHALATAGGPPSTQLLHVPSTAVLSHDRVDFGLVCVRTDNCRVVVLTNVSSTATLGFAWDEAHPLVASKRVRCVPSQGQLLPLQHVFVRVLVQPQDELRVIDHDFACWIRVVRDTATAPTSTTLSSLAASSTLSSSLDHHASTNKTPDSSATRPSVITRSTVSSRSHVNRSTDTAAATSAMATSDGEPKSEAQKWRLPGALANDDGPMSTPPVPVFLHVFAHVVPLEFFRTHVHVDTFRRHALPTQDFVWVDALATMRSTWGYQDPRAAKESRHVLEGVLGHLLVDVLNAGAVTEVENRRPRVTCVVMRLQAMAELPKEPPTPAFVQLTSTARLPKAMRTFERLRRHDHVKRLTATVLENTMFNLIQEIACGDFDLTCLPKQLVFHLPDDGPASDSKL
ncbi:hypothetical protein DYB32_004080, partial [Aphanomyces invadans]